MSSVNGNPWIWKYEKKLDSDFCRHVIRKFDRDFNLYHGVTLGDKEQYTRKISTDLCISNLPAWKKEDATFGEHLHAGLDAFWNYCDDKLLGYRLDFDYPIDDSGYQIQRSKGGEGKYDWHHDAFYDPNGFDWSEKYGPAKRYFTFIWYLNDVPGPGGYTEFYDGTQIQPEEGQMIIFPSTHTFIHRGVRPPVGQDKYICTGWIYHPMNRA